MNLLMTMKFVPSWPQSQLIKDCLKLKILADTIDKKRFTPDGSWCIRRLQSPLTLLECVRDSTYPSLSMLSW